MADTFTTNLNLTKPEVGASDDSWGTKLNADLDTIDGLFDTGPVLKVAKGGTGAATAAGARTALGLGDAATGDIGTDVQAYDATLTSLAALGTAADKLAYTTGVDTWAETGITSFGRSLIDDADAAAARTTLELGNAATGTIGTDVQAYDALLADIAGMTLTSGDILYADGAASLAQLAKGSAGQVLTMNTGATAPEWADAGGGVEWTSAGTAATTSGNTVTVTGIPSSAREIMFVANGVRMASGTASDLGIRLGDSGGVETTGYLSQNVTNSILMYDGASTNYFYYGSTYLFSDDGLTWYANGTIGNTIPGHRTVSGIKTLSATLDRVAIWSETQAFNAGSIEVWYR